MYKIVRKKDLNASVCLLEIEAPFVARKARPASSSFSASTRWVSAFP